MRSPEDVSWLRCSSGLRRKLRLLLVEDDDDMRLLLREHFESVGYQVDGATDGNQAISSALQIHPDVIVLDLMMPRLDGWATIDVLRTYPTTRTIPIVACTGSSDDRLREASPPGYDAIIRKPCTPEAVAAAVSGILGGGAPPDSDRSDAG
jgi:CheY-like chemotaxis protein